MPPLIATLEGDPTKKRGRSYLKHFAATLSFFFAVAFVPASSLGVSPLVSDESIRVLIVTGDHDFNSDTFFQVFEGHDDIDIFRHHNKKGQNTHLDDISEWDYDVLLLYNMTLPITDGQRRNLKTLLDRGVGLFPLHHGILTYSEWLESKEIYGREFTWEEFGGHNDQEYVAKVADPKHPITDGFGDFQVMDETYTNYYGADRPNNHVLLTTTHQPSDAVLAWVRNYSKARVFCLQLGHDTPTYTNSNYRALVARGIRWVAGRLPESAGGEVLDATTIYRRESSKE